jgi:2-polyprenyl-3-methyl-5-hydroxy-6-metoxy-1,4-benzoquinol methylase
MSKVSGFELVELQETLYTSKNPTRRWLHCTRRDWIVDELQRCASKGRRDRALEVGPGSGIYLPVLAKLYTEVTASDVEQAYLKHAGALTAACPNLRLVSDDITHTKLPESSFDLILCTEVIEHISDSASAIAGMHRLLNPGGSLVLSTPQRWSVLELTSKLAFMPGIINLVRLIYAEPVLETGHINLMTDTQVISQLEGAGFKIIERFKSGMYLPLIAEFAGQPGLRLEQWLESKLRGGPMDWLLWEQYYIARK